jgi:RHS repeat-associated protein
VAGDLSAVIDPLGRRTEYRYDDLGQLTLRRRVADNQVVASTWFSHDVFGNQTSTVDLDGNAIRTDYDALNRPMSITENGATTTRSYNSLGQLATETDPGGATTRYRYDLLGRRTIISPPHPDGRDAVERSFDDSQAQLSGDWYVDSQGWQGSQQLAQASAEPPPRAVWHVTDLVPGTTYEVLATWHPGSENTSQAAFRLEDGDAEELETVIVDQRTLASDVVDGDQAWQRLAFVTPAGESLDVVLASTGNDGLLVADGVRFVEVSGNSYTSYDVRGNVLTRSDALGNIARYTYDHQSHRTSSTNENGETTWFNYDPLGRLESVVDPLGNVTSYGYDRNDRVIAEWIEQDGEQLVTQYQYDAVGNLEQVVDRLGRVRVMQYDPLGRSTGEVWYESVSSAQSVNEPLNVIQRSYDMAGRVTRVLDNSAEYEYSWDDLDRLVSTVADVSSAPPVELRNRYTRHDHLRNELQVSVSGTVDHVNQYHYTPRGLLASIRQSGAEVEDKRVDFDYSAAGQLEEIQRYAGAGAAELVAASHYNFDGQGRLASLQHRQGERVLADYQWVHDAANRIVQQDSSQDGVARFQYDALGQLLEADSDALPSQSYEYDVNGNRSNSEFAVGDRNLLETDGRYRYEYDAQGNRVLREELATGHITTYRWDHLNRLVEIQHREQADGPVVSTVAYSYDALGRRVSKRVSSGEGPVVVESFVYDDQDLIVRFESGNVANRYLHGPMSDQVLADEQVDSDGAVEQVYWALADHVGSVRDLVHFDSESGISTVANHITYEAFGGIAEETAAAVDHIFGFTGRERDTESDLHYYRARYYDPAIGQFISEDPAGFAAGDVNLRRYVENDPINRVDPTGMYGDDVHFYFNYYLARYLGLDQPSGWVNSNGQPVSEALIIAYFATRVDYDGMTKPFDGAGLSARRRFHFPDPVGKASVVQDDFRVRRALRSVGRAADVEMFGLLLHVYQDSFAHVGLNASTGHANKAPDQPYLHPRRDRLMAQKVYEQMVGLLLARRGVTGGPDSPEARALLRGRSFGTFWAQISSVLLQKPPGVRGVSETANRVLCWQQLIAKDFRNARPRFTDTDGGISTPLNLRFRRVSEKVPLWYSKSYDHEKYWGNWTPVR